MKNKFLKKGLWTSSIICVIIIAIIAVNVLISNKDYSVDVTQNKLYSLSDQTKKIVSSLDQNIVIYLMNNKTDMAMEYKRIFNEYAKASDKIKLVYKDPELYPNFSKKYVEDEVSENSAIVVCGEKSRYISSDEYVNYSYSDYGYSADSLQLETLVTQAIDYVISEKTPVIYTLTGHEESDLDSSISSGIETDNYEIKELNFLTQESIPEDCSLLLINGGKKDLSKDEIEKIKNYLKDEGKLYVLLGEDADNQTRLCQFLKEYGITVQKGMVVENDSSMYTQYPIYLLPSIQYTEVSKDQYDNNVYILAPGSKGLTVAEDSDNGYTVESLLNTSEDSFSKVNMESSTWDKEKGDIEGPFAIAAAVSDDNGGKIIVNGCANMLNDQIDTAVNGSNTDFVLNGINYLTDQESKISIRAKSLSSETMIVPEAVQKMGMVFLVILIPLCLLVTGIFVVMRRRKL